MMSDKIKTALVSQEQEQEQPTNISTEENQSNTENESKGQDKKIVTTEEELEAFFTIKNALKHLVSSPKDITYKDNERYMAILYKDKVTKWICRLYFNSAKKFIVIPDKEKNKVRYDLEDVYDIDKYIPNFEEVLKKYL